MPTADLNRLACTSPMEFISSHPIKWQPSNKRRKKEKRKKKLLTLHYYTNDLLKFSGLINSFLTLQDDAVALQLPPLWSPPYSAANFKQCTKHNIKLINYNKSCCHLTGVHRSFGTADGLMAERGNP